MKPNLRLSKILPRLALILVFAVAAVSIRGDLGVARASHSDWPDSGMICTENPTSHFTLDTKEGHITFPDGNVVYMWGFSEAHAPFQHPGPNLCVNEGDTVTIVLHNNLGEDVSIIFPGQENVLANGLPAQPQYDGSGNLTSLTNVATANGGTITYSFTAQRPGTFLYQSGTEPMKQVNMGLFGALVVRPAGKPNWAYNEIIPTSLGNLTTQFKPSTEYLMILSEIDPMLHQAVQEGLPYDMSQYQERYWLINGRSFPDTIAPNGADWLPSQPYSSLVHIQPYNGTTNPDPALVRYISVGKEDYPFHPHGNHMRTIAKDGHLLIGLGDEDLSYEKFTTVIGPGQTVDALFNWVDVDLWHPTQNPITVTIPQLQNLTFGQFYSGSPYLGNLDALPVGTQALNQCGEYYHIAHNHALHKITAWAIVLSGHITFSRIDPPEGCVVQ